MSGQLSCDGTETFERVTGVNISADGLSLTPLHSEAGGTVTAQCNNRYEKMLNLGIENPFTKKVS